ncbi:MAG TPA: hypothetical protein VMU88_06845 [bacterium]|nr:hypothetical protein [bacterium]
MVLKVYSLIRKVLAPKRSSGRFPEETNESPIQKLKANRRSQEGNALIMAVILSVAATTLITVGTRLIKDTLRQTQQQQLYVAQAEDMARAGLVDALGWFRRQPGIVQACVTCQLGSVTTYGNTNSYGAAASQPDDAFSPTLNASVSDTANPSLGIVEDLPLDSAINTASVHFGRYEVLFQPNPTATVGATIIPNAVHDVSGTRILGSMNGKGQAWLITSSAYIYKRLDYTTGNYPGPWNKAYNQSPNVILARARMSTELRKMSVNLPYSIPAAVFTDKVSKVRLANNFSNINGTYNASSLALAAIANGSASVSNPSGATSINFSPYSSGGAGVTAMTGTNVTPLSTDSIFGMSLNDIQFIADYTGNASTPMTIADYWKLSYFSGNLTYSASSTQSCYQTLDQDGILVVNGNLSLSGGTTTTIYRGVVYVTGNLTMGANSEIDGVVLMGSPTSSTGSVSMTGSTGSQAFIYYDPGLISEALTKVGVYRENISQRQLLFGVPNL